MKAILLFFWLVMAAGLAHSQEITHERFPDPYYRLTSDTARLRYLAEIINDSIDENQLTHVYSWSQTGLDLAGKQEADSMKGKFYFYIAKAFTYQYNRYDSAIYYYKKVIAIYPDIQRNYHFLSLREIMERYADMGIKDSSFVYLNQLLNYIDTIPDQAKRKISLSQNIATVYQWFGMHQAAIHYFQVAINGNQLNHNDRGLGLALANLGQLYSEMNNDQKAIETSKQALIYLADVPMPFCLTATNLADFYANVGDYDSSLRYVQLSAETEKKINNPEIRLGNNLALSIILLHRKDFDSARQLLQYTLGEYSLHGNRWNMARSHINLARLDSTVQDYPAAIQHFQAARDISRKDGTVVLELIALQGLSDLYKKTGQYQQAYAALSGLQLLKDSLQSTRAKTELADLEISHNILKKEQQIELLQKDNDLKNLQLRNSRQQNFFILGAFLLLLLIFAIIIYQRNQKNRIRTEKLRAELETQILRLQMNPHFIFNSLNSIENFIMKNEKRLASDYLNKFARLIRMILDNSMNDIVPLSKDMEALQLYIDLEQLRFNHRFSYNTVIDPALLSGDYRVPSLVIQPFVENAIVHGFAHSEDKQLQLTVTASLKDDRIHYTVEDNGVGRKKAAEYNRQNKPYHKSVGLRITEERISLFNQSSPDGEFVQFTDLTDEQQQGKGTKVDILLKAS